MSTMREHLHEYHKVTAAHHEAMAKTHHAISETHAGMTKTLKALNKEAADANEQLAAHHKAMAAHHAAHSEFHASMAEKCSKAIDAGDLEKAAVLPRGFSLVTPDVPANLRAVPRNGQPIMTSATDPAISFVFGKSLDERDSENL